MKKYFSRIGVGTVRIALAVVIVAVLVILRASGADTSALKRGLESGGSAVGVVNYVVGKYNEFTA